MIRLQFLLAFVFLCSLNTCQAVTPQKPKLSQAAQKVLHYWFGSLTDNADFPDDKLALWFRKDTDVDEEICNKFKFFMISAGGGLLENWKDTPRGRLALIILLDQFPRHIYRGKKEAFKFDKLAQQIVIEGIEEGADKKLLPIEKVFFYMPLEHAENLHLQEMSIDRFHRLVEDVPSPYKDKYLGFEHYAYQHEEIIKLFGRFPHRNEQLQRESTPEEIDFLQQPGSSF